MTMAGWVDPEELADGRGRQRRPKGHAVTLDEGYLRSLAAFAARSAIDMRRTNRHNAQGFHELSETVLTGVYGEAAFLWLHGERHPMYCGPDGKEDYLGYQVRTTRLPEGCLWCYDEEPPDLRLVLVIDQTPRFKVVGWATAETIRQHGTRKAGRGRKAVSYLAQKYLRPYSNQADLF